MNRTLPTHRRPWILGAVLALNVLSFSAQADTPGERAAQAATTAVNHAVIALPPTLKRAGLAFQACWDDKLYATEQRRQFRRHGGLPPLENWSEAQALVWDPCVPMGVDALLSEPGDSRTDRRAMQAWLTAVRPQVQAAWQHAQGQP